MAARQPPRFVPTLTEVVVPSVAGAAGSARAGAMLAEEQLVHRIMQRIDLTLERRLREAVATVVIEQTRLLAPLLREEIEEVVRQTVSQALSEELTGGGPPGAAGASSP
jgi:hypothetical protein